jgi:hypothetical protein
MGLPIFLVYRESIHLYLRRYTMATPAIDVRVVAASHDEMTTEGKTAYDKGSIDHIAFTDKASNFRATALSLGIDLRDYVRAQAEVVSTRPVKDGDDLVRMASLRDLVGLYILAINLEDSPRKAVTKAFGMTKGWEKVTSNVVMSTLDHLDSLTTETLGVLVANNLANNAPKKKSIEDLLKALPKYDIPEDLLEELRELLS